MNSAFSFGSSLIMPAYHHPIAYKTACSTFQDAKLSKTFMILPFPTHPHLHPQLPLVGCDLPDSIFYAKVTWNFWQLMFAYE